MAYRQVTLRAKGQTDAGLVRASNQDALCVDQDAQFCMVADGMGGHAGGEIASQLCIQYTYDAFEKWLSSQSLEEVTNSQISNQLVIALNLASTKIYERALEDPALKGMGTTATLVKIVGQHAHIAQVGDSRLYLLRSGFLYQLTQDHSLVREQVAAGVITEEEAKLHQLRNVITRSIGFQEEEYVDTEHILLKPGDFLILCSDGLHGKVSNDEISETVQQYETDAVQPLVDIANERGGEDNITVVIAKIGLTQDREIETEKDTTA